LVTILFTTDTITDAFELAAFAVLGLALVAFAGAAAGGGLVDLLLVASGTLLVPAWLIWTGRLLRGPTTAISRPGG
jgi:hypothetical protein